MLFFVNRDAACFVIWSFSRSFSTYHLAPYLSSLSTPLVLTSLFDREVNCRRAASAAFQVFKTFLTEYFSFYFESHLV